MNLSTQRHGTLYMFKEILYIYQEIHGGKEIIAINKNSV